jgi:hypothetical protein
MDFCIYIVDRCQAARTSNRAHCMKRSSADRGRAPTDDDRCADECKSA